MKLKTAPYLEQKTNWAKEGRVILAQYDSESIIVYQAYRPSIGHFAAENGYFGGDFKLSRWFIKKQSTSNKALNDGQIPRKLIVFRWRN